MEMKGRLIRSCTLTENVQDLLLEYLKDDDIEELENLLQDGEVEVNYIYKDASEFYYEDKNALQIACAYFADETSEKCIKLLLEHGADIFYKDPDSQKNSLNFAAESGNYKILKTILKYIKRKQIDISNSDVIYTLIKYVRDSEMSEEKFVPILKLLLKSDIDINYQNVESGWTTIYIACKYKFKQFVQLILNMRKTEINLDEFKDRKGKSARDLIIDFDLYKGELPARTEENSNVTIFTLYKNIRCRAVENFTENYEIIEKDLNENDQYLLLNMAVKYRLERVVKILLDKGVYYKKYSNEQDNPMILAAQRGYFKIIKLFMSTKPNAALVNQAIFELLKTTYTAEQSDNVNYNKCLTLLLKAENLDVNAKDYNNNTALHYALRYQDQEMTLKILRKGAKLSCRDSFNRLAIADMDALTLETHFNECIRYENEELAMRDDARILIDFTSLLPIKNNTVVHENYNEKYAVDVESLKSTEIITNDIFVPETEVLEYMCTSEELKHQLKHPLILAFLFLKWYRVAKFFYANLTLYIFFVLSLLTYITFGYNTKGGYSDHGYITGVSYGILLITFLLILIREMSQMALHKHRYFYKFENWLEIILLIVTTGILTQDPNEPLMRQFSAVGIVIASIEFLLLVGQFPAMSTNIMMLRTVSFTFFKLLLWYSILLFAFSYSFYTLFQERSHGAPTNSTADNKNEEKYNNDKKDEDDDEQDFFIDPGMSLLKTIVMLTGEFDAASIKFNTFPVISHIIFVIFVFLIAIVLFNLLNGLAVSDTQIIKNDAELYGQILRVEHIAHIEGVLLTNKIIHWLPIIKRISLFPLNTQSGEAVAYPNQNWRVHLMGAVNVKTACAGNCFRQFLGTYFNKKVQQDIRMLMKDIKEEKLKKKREEQMLADITDLRSLVQTLVNKQS